MPHHFFVLMPYGDTPFGFFCACVWGWLAGIYLYFGKTENLKRRHSGGLKFVKIPQILRLAIFGDTGICQVASAWYTKKIPLNSLWVSCFSNECNGEFRFTNCRPLDFFLYNKRVTRKSEIFVFITNAHQSIDIAVSPIAVWCFSGISFCVLTVFYFMFLRRTATLLIVQSGIEFHFRRRILNFSW